MTDTMPISATASTNVPKPLKIVSPPVTIEPTCPASGKAASSSAPSAIIQNEPSAEPKYVHQKVERAEVFFGR